MQPAGRSRQGGAAASVDGGLGNVKLLSREDLQDKFLRLREDHQELKKLNKTQEEKMKRMATKLIRLTNDFKKDKQVLSADVEQREMADDLKRQVHDLKQKNEVLARKLQVCRQDLEARQRQGPYRGVQPRIDTGIARPKPVRPRPTEAQDSAKVPSAKPSPASPLAPRFGHSLLEEERLKTVHLHDVINQLEAELDQQSHMMAAAQEASLEKMGLLQASHNEDMERMRQALLETQRKNIADDVSLIKLQREVREKSAQLEALHTKFLTAEQQVEKLKVNHSNVIGELSDLQDRYNQEEDRCHELQQSVSSLKVTRSTVIELQEMVEDLRAEKKLLQESNDQLVSSAFDERQERQHRAQLQLLQDKIDLLERNKKKVLMEKGELLDQLTSVKDQLTTTEKERSSASLNFYKLKEDHEKLTEKMQFFSENSSVDFSEMEEALAFIKSRKLKDHSGLSILHPVPEELSSIAAAKQKAETELHRMQTVYTQTRQELEKTRHLLKLQLKITSETTEEKKLIEKRLLDVEAESEEQAKEHRGTIAKRTVRIRSLEQQLHDLAYGTRKLKIKQQDHDEDDDGDMLDVPVQLEPGHNRLQIHVGELHLTEDGKERLADSSSLLYFVSLDFLDFESALTGTLSAERSIDFNFTAEYTVPMDDLLIYTLQEIPCHVELNSSVGSSWTTLGIGNFHLRDLLTGDKQRRLHGSVTLIGTGEYMGVQLATVQLWTRLCCSVERAWRLYRERMKARNYITANQAVDAANEQQNKAMTAATTLEALGKQHPGEGQSLTSSVAATNNNKLEILVESCSHLPMTSSGQQPSPYVVYKLWNKEDHCTATIKSSSNPIFNDKRSMNLPISSDTDDFLRCQVLSFYVFDSDDDQYLSHIGVADVVMVTLLRQLSVSQGCPILDRNGTPAGLLHVKLSWLQPYVPGVESGQGPQHSFPRKTVAANRGMPAQYASSSVSGDDDVTVGDMPADDVMSTRVPSNDDSDDDDVLSTSPEVSDVDMNFTVSSQADDASTNRAHRGVIEPAHGKPGNHGDEYLALSQDESMSEEVEQVSDFVDFDEDDDLDGD